MTDPTQQPIREAADRIRALIVETRTQPTPALVTGRIAQEARLAGLEAALTAVLNAGLPATDTRSVWVNGQYIGQDSSDGDTI